MRRDRHLDLRAITRPLVRWSIRPKPSARAVSSPSGTPHTGIPQRVRAMNSLSGQVRSMLDEESARLEQLRRDAQHDALTGLLNREHS